MIFSLVSGLFYCGLSYQSKIQLETEDQFDDSCAKPYQNTTASLKTTYYTDIQNVMFLFLIKVEDYNSQVICGKTSLEHDGIKNVLSTDTK